MSFAPRYEKQQRGRYIRRPLSGTKATREDYEREFADEARLYILTRSLRGVALSSRDGRGGGARPRYPMEKNSASSSTAA
jgi:hypothetical protein